jgi:hypothetical protein
MREETASERDTRQERWRAIEQSACPHCDAGPGERCRGISYSSPPHFARREQAITDGHYQP